jgi:16S rRNA (uracil1498-N3)-methyltransferase
VPAGRFLIQGSVLAAGGELELPAEVAHQARDVLRLVPGDTLRLLDGAGGEYPAALVVVERKRVVVRLGARAEGHSEPAVRVVLYQGMLKAAKFEWVLQKGTELGVAAFVPLVSERAVAAAEEAGEAKRRRWQSIIVEALEQCGGCWLPELRAPQPFTAALAKLPPGAVALIPWEGERATSLRAALAAAVGQAGASPQPREVRLFIGPEGGFAAGEIALAARAGAIPVSLGPRILRSETAAVVAAALTLDALGESGARGLGG